MHIAKASLFDSFCTSRAAGHVSGPQFLKIHGQYLGLVWASHAQASLRIVRGVGCLQKALDLCSLPLACFHAGA